MAAKKKKAKATSARGKQFGAKAEFIRKHPDLSAREVVEAAAKGGLTILLPHVYNLRAAANKRGPAPGSTPAGGGRAGGDRGGANAKTEAAFRRLVLELGVPRARALLEQVERRLAALIDGR